MILGRPLLFAFVAAVLAAAACGGNSDAPELSDPNAIGSELVNKYAQLVKDGDAEGLDEFISDAFIIQRADGSTSEKTAYLESLPVVTGELEISEVTARQTGASLIVRWVISVNETIDGRSYSSDPAPRLSTFTYEDGEWLLSSHANFLAPAAEPGADGVTETVRQVLAESGADTAPGQLLELTRVIIPAGSTVAAHTHPGPQLALVAEGTLMYIVIEGEVTLTRRAGTEGQSVEVHIAGDAFEINAGDAILEPRGMIHEATNETTAPVIVYLSSLFPEGEPAASQVE